MCAMQPKKLLIMNILDILKKYTDENHRLSQKEIEEILLNEYEMKTDRKAVKRNLMNLIEFGYDLGIEMALAKGNTALVQFIEDLRKQAEEKSIRATFSYRCISMVVKLEKAGMQIEEIIKIAVVKGMDKDTINTFTTNSGNKYSEALYKVKKAA